MNVPKLLVRLDSRDELAPLEHMLQGQAAIVALEDVARHLGFDPKDIKLSELLLIARAAANLSARTGVTLPVVFTALRDTRTDDEWAQAFLLGAATLVRGVSYDVISSYVLPGSPVGAALLSLFLEML